jgi:hypothetical protein
MQSNTCCYNTTFHNPDHVLACGFAGLLLLLLPACLQGISGSESHHSLTNSTRLAPASLVCLSSRTPDSCLLVELGEHIKHNVS